MRRLSSHNKVPPGEFYYFEHFQIAGRKYKKQFGPTPEVGALAARLAAFRKVNQLPGSDIMVALENIDSFTVARLNNDPRWTIETDVPWGDLVAQAHGPGCSSCGGTPTT